MSKGQAKAPSQRQLKVGEELRHTLAWVLERGEVRDPAVANTALTITEVSVSPDLKNAIAYVVPLGGATKDMDETLKGLHRAGPYLRRRIAERVQLRHTPRLNFAVDTSFEYAGHIEGLLHRPEVARDIESGSDENGEAEGLSHTDKAEKLPHTDKVGD
jgi:ribosome-binding factor A